MNSQTPRGMSRQGLDSAFEAEETRKSALILEARLLGEQGKEEPAAHRFAEAAEIEEKLSDLCETKGLLKKSVVSLDSGDRYQAELSVGRTHAPGESARSKSQSYSRACSAAFVPCRGRHHRQESHCHLK